MDMVGQIGKMLFFFPDEGDDVKYDDDVDDGADDGDWDGDDDDDNDGAVDDGAAADDGDGDDDYDDDDDDTSHLMAQVDMTDEESKKKIFQVPDFIGFASRQLGEKKDLQAHL